MTARVFLRDVYQFSYIHVTRWREKSLSMCIYIYIYISIYIYICDNV